MRRNLKIGLGAVAFLIVAGVSAEVVMRQSGANAIEEARAAVAQSDRVNSAAEGLEQEMIRHLMESGACRETGSGQVACD